MVSEAVFFFRQERDTRAVEVIAKQRNISHQSLSSLAGDIND